MNPTPAERRKYFRVEAVIPVLFRLIEEKTSEATTNWINGSTADISLGGVKVTAPMTEAQIEAMVDRYVLVDFSFKLPGAPKPVGATATVAYFLRGATAAKMTNVTFGLSFVTTEESVKDLIGEFIRKRISVAA